MAAIWRQHGATEVHAAKDESEWHRVEAAVDAIFEAALDPKNILNPGKGIGA